MVLIEEVIMSDWVYKIRLIEMVMKLDITNVCVALCLTILGYFLGASKSEIVDIDLSSILTVIISVSGLMIANQALYTWRAQFKHLERHKSLVAAEISFKNYWNYQDEVRSISLRMRQDAVTKTDPKMLEKTAIDFTLPTYITEQRNLKQLEYQRSWNELKIHCSGFIKKNHELEPDALSKHYRKLAMELHSKNYESGDAKYMNFHDSSFRNGVKAFHVERAKIK
jgi:hypothetical protein